MNTIPSLQSLCLKAALPLCNVREEDLLMQEAQGPETDISEDLRDTALLVESASRQTLQGIFRDIPGLPVDAAIRLNPLNPRFSHISRFGSRRRPHLYS